MVLLTEIFRVFSFFGVKKLVASTSFVLTHLSNNVEKLAHTHTHMWDLCLLEKIDVSLQLSNQLEHSIDIIKFVLSYSEYMLLSVGNWLWTKSELIHIREANLEGNINWCKNLSILGMELFMSDKK